MQTCLQKELPSWDICIIPKIPEEQIWKNLGNYNKNLALEGAFG